MSLTQEQKNEVEKVFKFLDKEKKELLTGRQVIIGLGILGKTCTIKEKNQIKSDYSNCDLDTFMNLCAEKANFNDVDAGLIKSFSFLESQEKPGYISQKDFIFVLKRFIENITDKDINDITKEVGVGDDGYINLESLAREMLLK